MKEATKILGVLIPAIYKYDKYNKKRVQVKKNQQHNMILHYIKCSNVTNNSYIKIK